MSKINNIETCLDGFQKLIDETGEVKTKEFYPTHIKRARLDLAWLRYWTGFTLLLYDRVQDCITASESLDVGATCVGIDDCRFSNEFPDSEFCESCGWKALRLALNRAKSVVEDDRKPSPVIVCLCGSTRFMDDFFEAGWAETLQGKIVLSVGVCKHAEDHGGEALGQEVADMLDELHLRKIDLADEVFILNVGGYIGPSTRKELEYAQVHGKTIRYLEPGEGD